LTVNLTLRCNLACVMCTTCYDSPELSREEVLGLIDQASAWGVRVFNPLGGEAFVRKDLEDILEHAIARQMFVTLTTNATLISESRAARVSQLPPEQLHINVSIDGLEPTHDHVRGAGNFRRAVAGYRMLRAADAAAGQPRRKILANVILHRKNMAEFPELLERLAAEGFSGVQVLNLFRNPKDPTVAGMWFLPEDLPALSELVGRLVDDSPLPILTPRADLLRIPRYYEAGLTPLEAPCWAGWKELYVNADGTAIMCDGKLDFLAGQFGSVREHTLKELWSSPAITARRAVVKQCATPCLQNCYLRREADSGRAIVKGALQHAASVLRTRFPPAPAPWADALGLELCDVPLTPGPRLNQVLGGAPVEVVHDPDAWRGLRDRGQLSFDRGFMGANVVEGFLGELRGSGRAVGVLVLAGRGDPLLHPELERVWAACAAAVSAGVVGRVEVRSGLSRPLPDFAHLVGEELDVPWISWDGWLARAGDPTLQAPVGDALKLGIAEVWGRLS
jgi:MoaA/NifB/PqqE/SkfB family radical SAM enzyme